MSDVLDLEAIQTPKRSITLKEIKRRLKENPNDIEAKKQLSLFIQKIGDFGRKQQPVLDDLLHTPVAVINLAKDLSSPKYRHKVAIVDGISLFSKVPKTGSKHKVARKIARLFLKSLVVDNFEIMKCIKSTITGYKGVSKKFTKGDYLRDKELYDKKIMNRFKYLKKIASKMGYTFKFHKSSVEAVRLTNDN